MIEKLRRKFILYTMLSVFALLLVILSAINISNFSLVSVDADKVTAMLAMNKGSFGEENNYTPKSNSEPNNRMMPMGPENSAETISTTRYFTYSMDKDGNIEKIALKLSAIDEENAKDWAESLLKGSNYIGWTRLSYRYRIYTVSDDTYVTVIDQSRELRPSFQVLYFSIFGSIIGLIITLLILIPVSKRLIKPFNESDAKQKKFISDAARELKVPITIIASNNKILENDETLDTCKSSERQINKINKLIKNLDSLLVLDTKQDIIKDNINISNILDEMYSNYEQAFKNFNKDFVRTYEPDMVFYTNANMFRKILVEIIENGLKYSQTYFNLSVEINNGRLRIDAINDAEGIKDGDLDRVFERFYRMDNAINSKTDGNGVGLSIVREIVTANLGRYSAKGENGLFHLKIEM